MNNLLRQCVFFCSLAFSTSVMSQQDDQKNTNESEESTIWSSIGNSAQSITDSTLKKADEITDDISKAYNDSIVFSTDSINGFLENLDSRAKLLAKIGYDVTSIYVNVGLIPGVTFKVERLRVLSIDAQNELLEQEDVGLVLQYVINKLNQAYDMQVNGYYTKDVNIRITINPGATVRFEKLV